MRRRHRFVALALVTAVTLPLACSGGDDGAESGSASTTVIDASTTAPTTTTALTPTTTTLPSGIPAPNGRRRPYAPTEPAALAAEIATTEQRLRDPATPAAERPALGHRNQAAYRALGRMPEWDDAVAAALPPELVDMVAAHASARRSLAAMHPDPSDQVPAWEIVAPAAPEDLLAFYREAEAATGIEWEYLAAINMVETAFGRIRGLSTAGARGPMQFLPTTWAESGIGAGDIDDPHDAIQAAARYLVRRGGPDDMPRALRGYNNSPNYVLAVTTYADMLRDDERALYVFHEWQVHYLSSAGDLWLPEGYREPVSVPVAEYLARAPWSSPPPA
jgi:hypothetical protein